MNIVLATRNLHKLQEMQVLLSNINLTILSLNNFPLAPEVEENGNTLEENAAKKAQIIAQYTGLWSLSDDTGLFVDALNGAPGVFSARYAGAQATYEDNIKKLLAALKEAPINKRRATFRTVAALVNPNREIILEVSNIAGLITKEPKGVQGFGYDPVFFLPELGKTLAELSPQEKNRVSHRAIAFEKIKVHLKKLLQ